MTMTMQMKMKKRTTTRHNRVTVCLVLSWLALGAPLSATSLQWYKVTSDSSSNLPLFTPIYTTDTRPVPPARYHPLITQVAREYQLDPLLMHAVIAAESAYHSDAISPKGAIGLMQLLPATAARFGKQNLMEPQENLQAGAAYLRQLIDQFDGRLDLAIAGYNAGEGAVTRYKNSIPPYPETQGYVRRVLNYYQQLQQQGIKLAAVAPVTTAINAPMAATEVVNRDATEAEPTALQSPLSNILTKIGDSQQVVKLFTDGPP